ncbi:hypothetical protein BDV12DRAFT_196157 [Aspergillus spectabilis]
MKNQEFLILTAAVAVAVGAVPLVSVTRSSADADEAVVYPAKIDQSWVDVNVEARSLLDADEAVVYPAKVDQSWVDAEV